MNLMARKDEIEKEIKEQQSLLESNHSTMTTQLVDSDGFPRGDIDVWTVRHARVRLESTRIPVYPYGPLITRCTF